MRTITLTFLSTLFALLCNAQKCGPFTINSNGDQIMFAPGNLQYNAALGTHACADGTTKQGTFRFAEHQYDYVGNADMGNVYWNDVKCNNTLASSTYDGWIDHFNWGTSGWNASNGEPWIRSGNNNSYFLGEKSNNNLYGAYAYADWGVYNQIGDDEPGTWRTLQVDEWIYIVFDRPNASSLHGPVTIQGILGYMILPDDWTAPQGITFSHSSGATYTYQQWEKLEESGAVFFPSGSLSSIGNYWLSDSYGNNAYRIFFQWGSENLYSTQRNYSLSVRLAKGYSEPTALDEIQYQQQKTAVKKVIEDGKLYIILPNGTKYDSTGRRVK